MLREIYNKINLIDEKARFMNLKLVVILFLIIFSLIITITSAETLDYNHVIQIDSVESYPENKLSIIEVLYNFGTKEFNGVLRTWVPEGAEGIKISKIQNGIELYSFDINQNGNIISWQDINNPSHYQIKYNLTAKKSLNRITYSKMFIYIPLTNRNPNRITLILTRSQGDNISVNDENGNNISFFGNPTSSDRYFFYNWDVPDFKGININLDVIDKLDISAEIRSYSDNPNNEIYVGSLIFYNITVHNPHKYEISREFNISISDSDDKILHNILWDTGVLSPNQSKNFLPYVNDKKDYHYLSPLKADTYVLKVTNVGEPIIFYENKTIGANSFYRYLPNVIEFPFPVSSQYEKRLKERNEKQFNQNMELNNNMLSLTKKLEYYTLIIVFATIFSLFLQLFKRNT